jgi:hypothetical protein
MAKMKDFTVSVAPDDVMYSSISTSKDGYNSARMVCKKGEKEYMSISYEWEGETVPGFAMDLMAFMKRNNVETSGIWEGKEAAYLEFSAKKEMCKKCGKTMAKCDCGEKAEDDESEAE